MLLERLESDVLRQCRAEPRKKTRPFAVVRET